MALVVNEKLPASATSASIRANAHPARSRPCSAWWAALASSISLGTSTRPRHSSRHILQLTHSPATARTSSAVSAAGSASAASSRRSRLALARGVASSAPVARNTGHIRPAGDRVRQSPHPLQDAATAAGAVPFQISSGVRVPGSGFRGPDSDPGTRTPGPERSGHAGRDGSGPTILPGLKMPLGSKTRFSSRKTGLSGPYCFSTHGVRASPVPCRPLIVPPSASARAWTASASGQSRARSFGSSRSTNGRAWTCPARTWTRSDAVRSNFCNRPRTSAKNRGSSSAGTATSSTPATGRGPPPGAYSPPTAASRSRRTRSAAAGSQVGPASTAARCASRSRSPAARPNSSACFSVSPSRVTTSAAPAVGGTGSPPAARDRASNRWSSRSHPATPSADRSASPARTAASTVGNPSTTRHVPPAAGTVRTVASVTNPSVPSEPTSNFARSSPAGVSTSCRT